MLLTDSLHKVSLLVEASLAAALQSLQTSQKTSPKISGVIQSVSNPCFSPQRLREHRVLELGLMQGNSNGIFFCTSQTFNQAATSRVAASPQAAEIYVVTAPANQSNSAFISQNHLNKHASLTRSSSCQDSRTVINRVRLTVCLQITEAQKTARCTEWLSLRGLDSTLESLMQLK